MAQSRLERIGTIYTRTQSLLRGGAMKEEDKPIWYAIYEAFPPKVEPRYDRPAPKIPIREIFYEEDIIRARFQKDNKKYLATSLTNEKIQSRTQKFISMYQEMRKSGEPDDTLYSKAMEAYMAQNEILKNQRQENIEQNKLTNEKKEDINIDLKKIFAD